MLLSGPARRHEAGLANFQSKNACMPLILTARWLPARMLTKHACVRDKQPGRQLSSFLLFLSSRAFILAVVAYPAATPCDHGRQRRGQQGQGRRRRLRCCRSCGGRGGPGHGACPRVRARGRARAAAAGDGEAASAGGSLQPPAPGYVCTHYVHVNVWLDYVESDGFTTQHGTLRHVASARHLSPD